MKICYVFLWIILPFLFTPLLQAQNIINFDDQGWNPDQSLGTSFTANGFSFSGTRKFFTNYGYNFNVDSVSVFFLFGDKKNDYFSMSTPGNEKFSLISLNICQVSKQSTDSLVIEGWNGDARTYTRSFAYDTIWTTLNLNYENITKVIVKLDSTGNGGISDYNFDNIYYSMTIPNGIETKANLKPTNYYLSQNFPNPFNPSTLINYKIPEKSDVTIKVYNVLGKEIGTLVNESKEAGDYFVRFDGSSYPSGIYIYELRSGRFVSRAKMILIK